MNKPYAQLTKGTVLVASPDLNSGIYFRAVILLCEHGPNGSVGLIINKAPDFEIPEEVLNLKAAANPRIELRLGGPLQGGQLMMLHSLADTAGQALQICPGLF